MPRSKHLTLERKGHQAGQVRFRLFDADQLQLW